MQKVNPGRHEIVQDLPEVAVGVKQNFAPLPMHCIAKAPVSGQK